MAVFGWCLTNQHDKCKRKFQLYHFVPNKKRGQPPTKIEYLDQWYFCECKKRGCECYIPPADREPKKRKPRRKK